MRTPTLLDLSIVARAFAAALAVAAVTAVTSCSVPNPHDCSDGTCTDARYPFCDVDGHFPDSQGNTLTCVAVTCTPGEFAECRSDTAITCNSTGDNYDLIQCASGCDAASLGCRAGATDACATDAQCTDMAPVCDSGTSTCRACEADAECASGVCEPGTGRCTPDSAIVVVAPTGAQTGECSLISPCEFAHAVTVALADPQRSTVLLLPGSYSSALTVNSGSITLVGHGATLRATSGMYTFNITDTANVTIRGMALDLSALTGYCGGLDSTNGGTLQLSDATIVLDGLTFNAMVLAGCHATLDRVTIALTSHGQISPAMFVSDNVVLNADRLHITTTDASSALVFNGKQSTIHISNSLFENTKINLLSTETATQSTYAFFFNTIVTSESNAIDGTTSGNRILFVEDNVLVAATDAIACAQCAVDHNLTYPQTILVGSSNIVVDPQFASAATRDYHLTATSPAVDTASPSTGFATTHDFEGIARPQGAGFDLGALERHP